MCYSAMVKQSVRKLGFEFRVRESELDKEVWNFRAFPHGQFPSLVAGPESLVASLMNYSLIPSWSKVRKPKFATYNARVETIDEKPTWKTPLVKKHCIVPMTSFFESCYEGTHAGNMVQFSAVSDTTLWAAGIFDEWVDNATGEIVESFAIVTKDPSDFIKEVGHDRSPLFLNEAARLAWLQLAPKNAKMAKEFLLNSADDPVLTVTIERPLKPGWEKRR